MAVKIIQATAIQCTIFMSILLAAAGRPAPADETLIPDDASQVTGWFEANVKPYAQRKGTLNSTLDAAEANPKTIRVRKDGSGDFGTVTDAINSIPSGNQQRVIVDIGAGEYQEKIKIDREKPFVTLYGSSTGDLPTLTFGGTAQQYGTVYSATLEVEADYFVATNLIIKNSAPRPDGKRPGAQAVAFRIAGDNAAFYNCRFIGFQDTVCDDRGKHFYKDCYIEGTVDFIFGNAKSLYVGTELHVLADQRETMISAQARENNAQDTGFSFVHCSVTGDGTGAYLGRAWMEMPKVVYAYTTMSNVVNPAGWSDNLHPERDGEVLFGEYKNSGPGANPSGRAKFSKQLTAAEAQPYLSLGFIQGSEWLLPPPQA